MKRPIKHKTVTGSLQHALAIVPNIILEEQGLLEHLARCPLKTSTAAGHACTA